MIEQLSCDLDGVTNEWVTCNFIAPACLDKCFNHTTK